MDYLVRFEIVYRDQNLNTDLWSDVQGIARSCLTAKPPGLPPDPGPFTIVIAVAAWLELLVVFWLGA